MTVDTSGWSGEGEFTQVLVDALRTLPGIELVKVEDAPATRAESGYNFVSNELYVKFAVLHDKAVVRRFGFLPVRRETTRPAMSMADLEQTLAGFEQVGPADYSDEGMIQFLKTERIIPPYQTRGYKLVELVRIYRAG